MFHDREDAGEQLGQALHEYKDKDVIVLGIPRGGAETAYYVAKQLHAKLSLLISRKLGHPGNPEYAVGAIAEDGSIYINPAARGSVSEQEMREVIAFQKTEIKRRIEMFRGGKPLPDIKGKVVILTDDGIATGSTIFAAIEMCRNLQAGKIVVAAPISSREKIEELEQVADEVVVLDTPALYFGVSQGYADFYNLVDAQVIRIMAKWEEESNGNKAEEESEEHATMES
jgi:predicted phosphoribosyltransferase